MPEYPYDIPSPGSQYIPIPWFDPAGNQHVVSDSRLRLSSSMLDGDLTFQLHLELSVKYPLQQKFEEYISQDPFNSFDTGKTHTHTDIYIYTLRTQTL